MDNPYNDPGPGGVKEEVFFDLLSPSSSFGCSSLKDPNGLSDNCIISAIILSHWDNIMGPRIIHLWSNTYNQEATPAQLKTLRFVANHTLSGEITRDLSDRTIDDKFYVIQEKSISVTSFIFGAKSTVGKCVHSLSLVVPLEHLETYLKWHDLCVIWMKRLISRLKVLQSIDPGNGAIGEFSMPKNIQSFIQMLRSLSMLALPSTINISTTLLRSDHPIENAFLRKAIAAHLVTCGHSIVVGKIKSQLNTLVRTLALFLGATERHCSRLATSDNPRFPYHSDLSIQAIIKDDNDTTNIPSIDVLCSKFPSALIDMSTKEIHVTQPCHIHSVRRYEMMKQDLTCLWAEHREDKVYPTSEIFKPYNEGETLVGKLLCELAELKASCGIRETYIEQFIMSLERRALSLIKLVELDTNRGKTKCNVNKIKKDMTLTQEGDFHIVLSTAEKLQPGMYAAVYGDPKQITENFT
ncbi:unnamed protein product [Owenia fusiformis]|uniref:Uncharacterized protein n=1 Tax=Owenia fusiformis TaxID=6347 RepID=A0A8J1UAW8_OWEFU|nr:unnamed protein product [Owenia fusiformis]